MTVKKWEGAYTQDRALEDLPVVKHALDLFLASHMVEAEQFMMESNPTMERLYMSSGYGLIQCVKALMSYEDEDLLAAIGHTRHGNNIASQHRKSASFTSRLASLVSSSSEVHHIKSMTPVERHAELIYAETLFEKALLGIIYSGDWISFFKEALHMRTLVIIYRQLYNYLKTVDEEACARGEGPEDKSVDPDFRSGVLLGAGLSNIILTLLPGPLQTVVELFGFKGDRKEGLELLYRAGGWRETSHPDAATPTVSIEQEGVRRALCDMALLMYHLVICTFAASPDVDILRAQNVLNWNLERYPRGVFFLFGQGRLFLVRGQPKRAIQSYTTAMETQSQYRNLHMISYWEIAIANFALYNLAESLPCWRVLSEEATWSKACYAYGIAVCLVSLGGEENMKEAATWMEKVPKLMKRIAGKSIPLEKFVSRKARKFQKQNSRLALAALEFSYFYLAIARAPYSVIVDKMLAAISECQAKLRAHEKDPKKYEGGNGGYWDDLCLASFLEGVCYRYIAHPEPNAIVDLEEREKINISKEEAEKRGLAALQRVLTNGPKIELDHHLVYYTHFEMGRLYACMGKKDEARKHFDLILSGKSLEINAHTKKGKYSLESALLLRTHAVVDALGHGKPL
ncbi:uncharacterized protein FOMMEDRAFT_81128 [Fomitiporia mediterranea MF3/22]|uniref:uncharacterized protein n=1 Tax=Fomitiporia mediterranea (strain MF3/22) TaxID=694068 RepID=UPI0004407512|nr:uncharacterized protein FOMMEDRAFT_81128 [Fomitiporia mediterranea MF3/22]EJD05273.1 hypothetical protein FOMMEDRAFT_81128 [Fomitiporia mediterranea MF3/22]